MSQVDRRTRVQRLADSVLPGRVLPGRTVGGYANLIEARLRKLAATASTGMLPMSGHGDGAIFFRDGRVVYAESTRVPTPARSTVGLAALGLVATDAGRPSNGAELVVAPSFDRLVDMLTLTEPTIDAITELLSSESRYAKFRTADCPPSGQLSPLPIETVLAEVERRRRVLRQLAPVVTADSPVVRFAPRDPPRFQVSASQWSLLVRTGEGSSPRTLALALGRSVFGTTIEVYRLLALGMLVVPGHAQAITSGAPAQRPAAVMSFVRALSDAGGGDA
jgi:Domain of unknown function (DUF4388)